MAGSCGMGIADPSPRVACFDPRDEAPDQSTSVRASRKGQEQSSPRGDDVALIAGFSKMNQEEGSEAYEEWPREGCSGG